MHTHPMALAAKDGWTDRVVTLANIPTSWHRGDRCGFSGSSLDRSMRHAAPQNGKFFLDCIFPFLKIQFLHVTDTF